MLPKDNYLLNIDKGILFEAKKKDLLLLYSDLAEDEIEERLSVK